MLIFISYASSDKDLAFRVCDYLESHGQECWIAPRNISAGEYGGAISRAIKSSEIAIVICSSKTSSSSHVKNEISLAFDNGCTIIPFCYDNASLDDCMEYYFAGKQKVFIGKDSDQALDNLLKVITENSVTNGNVQDNIRNRHKSKWLISTSILLIISAVVILARYKNVFVADLEVEPDTLTVQESVITQDTVRFVQEAEVPPVQNKPVVHYNDSFTGKTKSGYPDGTGKYIFGQDRRIDMHDKNERVALKGDYIVGEWDSGHLIQGKWYGADGSVKGTIILGKTSDTASDKIFERCAD